MARKPVILSCADNASNKLEGRKILLEENGYQVLTAPNGKEAVQALVSNPVDLVLLDCHMPQKDGDVAAMQMKACKPDVPIALLYLLSLRLLFQPLEGSWADEAEAQRKHCKH